MEAPGVPGVPAAPLLPAPRTPAPGAPAAPAPAPSPANAADDDGYCGVCGSAHSEEGDALLFCDGPGCGVAVHQLCYGIRALPPEDEPWFCEPCHCDSARSRALAPADAAPSPPGARAPTSSTSRARSARAPSAPAAPTGPSSTRAAILSAFKRDASEVDAKTRDVGDAAWQDAWAHVACAAWIEEAGFADERRLSVALCGDLSARRARA
ncbi:chromatin organization protein [Aureococcus anophagefferens]|uniref:Chromatin organization protein n=1 Tax=Aureococcus anophagefferens TaxID=44056 RepID=A0ABR1GC07_AURAN